MKKKICGVYKITNIKNGKIYIGSSQNINQRWNTHIRELNKNIHANIFLQKDWTLYGKDCFKFEIVEECEPNKRWDLEQFYINKLMPFNRNNVGYNIAENSTKRNEPDIRIFKDTFCMPNPFYKCSKAEMQKIKNDEYYQLFNFININNTQKKIWYVLEGEYYIVWPIGGQPVKMDSSHVDSTLKENLLDEICGDYTYTHYLRQQLLDAGYDEDEV